MVGFNTKIRDRVKEYRSKQGVSIFVDDKKKVYDGNGLEIGKAA